VKNRQPSFNLYELKKKCGKAQITTKNEGFLVKVNSIARPGGFGLLGDPTTTGWSFKRWGYFLPEEVVIIINKWAFRFYLHWMKICK
jgi:hypothetical protein